MCRLYGFRANEPTKIDCGLILRQNIALLRDLSPRSGRTAAGGWGVGYYECRRPTVRRRSGREPGAWHFSHTAERVLTRTAIAHLRHAPSGVPSIRNAHPFRWGVWLMAHQGTISPKSGLVEKMVEEMGPAFSRLLRGSTDSERLFYWLLSRFERPGLADQDGCHNWGQLPTALAEVLGELDGRYRASAANTSPGLNLVLTDGEGMLAARFGEPLYWVRRQGLSACEICSLPHVGRDMSLAYRAVAVASEPLSAEAWQEVPDRTVIGIDPNLATSLTSLPERREAKPETHRCAEAHPLLNAIGS